MPYLQVSRGGGFRQGDLNNLPSGYVEPGAHPAVPGACQESGKSRRYPTRHSSICSQLPESLQQLCLPAALALIFQAFPKIPTSSSLRFARQRLEMAPEVTRPQLSCRSHPPTFPPARLPSTPPSSPGLLQLTSTVMGDSEGRR